MSRVTTKQMMLSLIQFRTLSTLESFNDLISTGGTLETGTKYKSITWEGQAVH